MDTWLALLVIAAVASAIAALVGIATFRVASRGTRRTDDVAALTAHAIIAASEARLAAQSLLPEEDQR